MWQAPFPLSSCWIMLLAVAAPTTLASERPLHPFAAPRPIKLKASQRPLHQYPLLNVTVSAPSRLSSDGALTTTTATAYLQDDLVPMKEIVMVQVVDPKSSDPPFHDRVKQLLGTDDTYVSFSHRGMFRGKSITFNGGGKGWVSLPLLATHEALSEPVVCEIKQNKKTLYKTDVSLIEDPTTPGIMEGVVRNHDGKDTGLRLKITVVSTEWDRTYASRIDDDDGPANLGSFFSIFLKLLKKQVKLMNLGGCEVLERPTLPADKDLPTAKLLDGLIEYPKEDEFLPLPFSAKVLLPTLNKFPVSSRNNPTGNRAKSINTARLALHDGVTEPYEGNWMRPCSDESMHRVYFSSMGQFLIKRHPETNGYVADLTVMNDLLYKPTYEKMGCKTFFDANGDITMIEDSDSTVYRPGDEYWEWAKLKSRTACFTWVSLDHIVNYHYTWACVPALALRKFLPPSHPARMAFSAHFFRTHYTCAKAKNSLVSEVGVLGRVLPFLFEGGLKKAYVDLLKSFDFKTYPQELEQQGLQDCDFHMGVTDGLPMHKIMMDYASNLLDEVYDSSEERLVADDSMRELYDFLVKKLRGAPKKFSMANLKLVWGEILFRVTGAHTSIGNAAVYAIDPLFVNLRLQTKDKGKAVASAESSGAIAGITAITMAKNYPRLSEDWSHVLKDPQSRAYAKLRADLEKLGQDIDQRNQSPNRRFVNRDYHPYEVAISAFG